jgi:type IV pilus assembly protein PilW
VYGGSASELSSVAQAWEYIHHVYYLDTENNVNRLRRLTLETSGMVREEVLAEGVEMMRFMFVLDHLLLSDRDGAVHSVVGASNVTSNDWSTGRVIGVKVFLLIKSLYFDMDERGVWPTPSKNMLTPLLVVLLKRSFWK